MCCRGLLPGINCLTSPCCVHTNRGDLPGQIWNFLKYRALNMKRVVASAGAFAMGMAGLHGANLSGLSPQETAKWWLLSASLNTFYDDNTLNQAGSIAEGSFGFQFSPRITANLPFQRSLVSAYYQATLDYYEARPNNNLDQVHEFNAQANHKFSERAEIDFEESFVYFDSPQIQASGSAQNPPTLRSDASGYRNSLTLSYWRRFTPVAGLFVAYYNTIRDYIEDGPASFSASLDSVAHRFRFDGRWYASPQTMYFSGYTLGIEDYTSSDPLGQRIVRIGTRDVLVNVIAEEKNTRSHTFYLGARHEFNRKLQGEGSLGVDLSEYYNNFPDSRLNVTPFAEISGTYGYQPGSNLKLGLNVFRTPTDFGYDAASGELTLDQLTMALTATMTHRITSRITGVFSGRYQHSVYNGGSLDGEADDYLTFQIGADYKIRENLFGSLNYSFNNLSSSRPGLEYSRNRISIGIRAVY
jgi:hypothetical protein